MPKALKIFAGVMIALGVISGIFLLTAKKKTPTAETKTQASKTSVTKSPASKKPTSASVNGGNSQASQDRKKLVFGQWQQCKSKTLSAGTNLIWNVQILEGIPSGGTYAKGTLESDSNLPVHVIIKADSPNVDKIKARLVVGKIAILRGNCTDVAMDGSVVLQAF